MGLGRHRGFSEESSGVRAGQCRRPTYPSRSGFETGPPRRGYRFPETGNRTRPATSSVLCVDGNLPVLCRTLRGSRCLFKKRLGTQGAVFRCSLFAGPSHASRRAPKRRTGGDGGGDGGNVEADGRGTLVSCTGPPPRLGCSFGEIDREI